MMVVHIGSRHGWTYAASAGQPYPRWLTTLAETVEFRHSGFQALAVFSTFFARDRDEFQGSSISTRSCEMTCDAVTYYYRS